VEPIRFTGKNLGMGNIANPRVSATPGNAPSSSAEIPPTPLTSMGKSMGKSWKKTRGLNGDVFGWENHRTIAGGFSSM
jgi:hypothetical protein